MATSTSKLVYLLIVVEVFYWRTTQLLGNFAEHVIQQPLLAVTAWLNFFRGTDASRHCETVLSNLKHFGVIIRGLLQQVAR